MTQSVKARRSTSPGSGSTSRRHCAGTTPRATSAADTFLRPPQQSQASDSAEDLDPGRRGFEGDGVDEHRQEAASGHVPVNELGPHGIVAVYLVGQVGHR